MSEKNITDIVADSIKPKLEEARMIGIKIGFESAWEIAYEQTKNMTNAKTIKEYIKNKRNEASIIVHSQSQKP